MTIYKPAKFIIPFIGIEKEKEYFEIAEARIESIEVKSTLQEFME